jgi:hypothetical protein
MANQLSLAMNQTLPAGWFPNPSPSAAIASLVDRNAVRVYEREKLIRYTVTLSGNYATHVRGQNAGEVLNLLQALVPASYQAEQFWGYRGPVRGYVLNSGGSNYPMNIVPGADCYHWLLVINALAAGGELAAGAYPAALTAELDIVVEFTGLAFD